LRDLNSLTDYEKNELSSLENEGMVKVMSMSNLTKEGIIEVRNISCNRLLTHRIKLKTQTNKIQNIANRIYIAQPTPRDKKSRTPVIVIKTKRNKLDLEKRTEKYLEKENGGFGIYNCNMRKFWKLKEENWKYDIIPEIWNGLNITDFVVVDILNKLDEIEKEENEIIGDLDEIENNVLSKNEKLLYDEIKFQKIKRQIKNKYVIPRNAPLRPREIRERRLNEIENYLEDFGYNLSTFSKRYKTVKNRILKKQKFSRTEQVKMNKNKTKLNVCSKLINRSNLRNIKIPAKGLNSIRETIISRNILYKSLYKMNKCGLKKTTCSIPSKKPKHLNTGKHTIGKNNWR